MYILLARLTAPSSIFPICPTVNTDAIVREYCRRNVNTRGPEYFAMTFVSRCHVVRILPEMTACSHFALTFSMES